VQIKIEIRLQAAALMLAEEQNFTRAAERLGITQPALSKQIGELEARLGFPVFVRAQKRVDLTDAGQVFIRGCRDAQAILERAIRLAKSAQDEVQPVVTIGHSPYMDPSLLSSVLAIHLPLYPTLRLRIESMFASELAHAVLVSELDLAIITEPSENPQLTLVKLATHPLSVMMPADHPAASKSSVSIDDFRGVGWMLFPRKSHPGIYDRLMEQAQAAATTPIELHHYVSPQETVHLISENFGVAFAAKGIAEQLGSRNIAVRPLSHQALRVTSYLVLRSDQGSRLINEFGRALIRRVLPATKLEAASGQLLLGL
jgi:DNA-binding transcriptional LysR family regulator